MIFFSCLFASGSGFFLSFFLSFSLASHLPSVPNRPSNPLKIKMTVTRLPRIFRTAAAAQRLGWQRDGSMSAAQATALDEENKKKAGSLGQTGTRLLLRRRRLARVSMAPLRNPDARAAPLACGPEIFRPGGAARGRWPCTRPSSASIMSCTRSAAATTTTATCLWCVGARKMPPTGRVCGCGKKERSFAAAEVGPAYRRTTSFFSV